MAELKGSDAGSRPISGTVNLYIKFINYKKNDPKVESFYLNLSAMTINRRYPCLINEVGP